MAAAASLVTIGDGTTSVVVTSYAMLTGSASQRDLETGHGEIEYANGSAKRWVRFERRALVLSGNGPAPHGLWALDLTVATWSVTLDSFDNDKGTDSWSVVPGRPQDVRDFTSGRTSWTLELRSAVAET